MHAEAWASQNKHESSEHRHEIVYKTEIQLFYKNIH